MLSDNKTTLHSHVSVAWDCWGLADVAKFRVSFISAQRRPSLERNAAEFDLCLTLSC